MICCNCKREIDRTYGAPGLIGNYCKACAHALGFTRDQKLELLITENERLTAENEKLRERHAALDSRIRADARKEFAEKLKNYYFNTLTGSTNSALVAYHIDQILADMERKEEQ
jgi:hypothetical protein